MWDMSEVAEVIEKLRAARAMKAEAEVLIKGLELQLMKVCEERQEKSLTAEIDGEQVTATMVQSSTVEFDSEALKGVLGERWNEAIQIVEKVDSKKVDQLMSTGVIPQEEISKVAKLKLRKPYFKLS